MEADRKIEQLAKLIATSKKIVAFSGAGISTESGIPDFRSPGGIWSKFNPADFSIDKYLNDPEARNKQWRFLLNNPEIYDAKPNSAHFAVAQIEAMGKLLCIITQNIDNLHQKAGSSTKSIYELHGNIGNMICLDCSHKFVTANIIANCRDSQVMPTCENCGRLLKPDVVLFGETLSPETLSGANNCARECDLFIVIGSSLVVYPAAYIPAYAQQSGAKVVIINIGETSFDKNADILIRESAGKVMSEVLSLLDTL